jgi:DNA-binding LacI/PurR family transcriptional regulator
MELNYPLRPDLLPASAKKKTNRIGVISPYLSRWFFTQAINGVEQSLREAGLDLLLYNFSQVDSRQAHLSATSIAWESGCVDCY